jgi:PKD repeat protein
MKLGFLFIIVIFGFSFLQHGCGNANNTNQSSANTQNLAVTLASPTPSSSVLTPANQNTVNNGMTFEQAKPFIELNERCKHTPIDKAKATPITGNAPLKVTFDGSASSDPDGGKIVNWKWLFGNGESAEGRKVTHVYEKPGDFSIGLIVTDSQGEKNSDCGTGATNLKITVTESQNTNENLIQKEN